MKRRNAKRSYKSRALERCAPYRNPNPDFCRPLRIISGDYGHGVFQAAYACDRFERVRRELQYHGSDVVMDQVKKELAKISGLNPPPEGWDDAITEVHIRIGFVHSWHIEAHVLGKSKEELSMQAIMQ
jgi:hypothetical protein